MSHDSAESRRLLEELRRRYLTEGPPRSRQAERAQAWERMSWFDKWMWNFWATPGKTGRQAFLDGDHPD